MAMREKLDDDLRVCRTPLRVRYAETDQMGVVYHSNYLVWFEIGRVEFMREHGVISSKVDISQAMTDSLLPSK